MKGVWAGPGKFLDELADIDGCNETRMVLREKTGDQRGLMHWGGWKSLPATNVLSRRLYASTVHGPEQDSNQGRVWRGSSKTEPESDDDGDGRRREDDELGVRLVRGGEGARAKPDSGNSHGGNYNI
jgi:hypothetical protein